MHTHTQLQTGQTQDRAMIELKDLGRDAVNIAI